MRDELNQYDSLEEQLRRELLKYEASFESQDWALMEEKLDKAGPLYLTFIHHPYFRLATAALFLLTSLYGVQSWVNTYMGSYPTESIVHAETTPTRIVKESASAEANGGGMLVDESLLVETADEKKNPFNTVNRIQGGTKTTRTTKTEEKNNYLFYLPPIVEEGLNYLTANFTRKNNTEELSEVVYTSNEELMALAFEVDEEELLMVPFALESKEGNYVYERKKRKRRMPGKRTIKTKITHSRLPDVPENATKGQVRVGVYGSADLNTLSLNETAQVGHSAGVEVNIKPKKDSKWAFVTGVGYSHKKFKTNDVPQNPMMSFITDKVESFYDNRTFTNTFTSEMEVVEVPLLVQYNFGNPEKKVQPYVEAGTTAYIPINQHYTYQSSSSVNQIYPASAFQNQEPIEGAGVVTEAVIGLDIRGEHVNTSNQPYFGIANVHAGVNVQLSKRVNVHVEGQFKTSLVNQKMDRSISDTNVDVGWVRQNSNTNNKKGFNTLGLQLGMSCAL